MGEQNPKAVSTLPDNTVIDVPHEPDAEAALIQETRERLSMLEKHIADPEAVASLQSLDEELASIMVNVAKTEEYNCNCNTELLED